MPPCFFAQAARAFAPRLAASLLSAPLVFAGVPQAQAAAYDGHPRLVVILVIDQFRADYLQRYRAEFKGRGFRLFLDKGAYFPDCYYGYANTKTAPGHATIGTGAYTDGHGISSNEWWDLSRNKQRPVSSVEDEQYRIVGLTEAMPPPASAQAEEAPNSMESGATSTTSGAPGAVISPGSAGATTPAGVSQATSLGASPRNLLASTIGDELRLATAGASRVYGVSLKDRAAILPAGAGANGAFWIDATTGRFVTSSYYMTALPDWATAFNSGPAVGQAAANVPDLTNFYKQVGGADAANGYEIAFAEALIAGEGLGTRETTDLLTLSLSPNDIEGHRFGPDSPEEHAMVDGLDADLDGFAGWLDTHVPGGLANVVLALSADHGIAPLPAVSEGLGLHAAYIDTPKLIADLNQAMNAKFSPGEHVEYVLPHQELPYLSLNRPSFERAGINEQEAEDAVKTALEPAFASLAASAPEPKKPDPGISITPQTAPPDTAPTGMGQPQPASTQGQAAVAPSSVPGAATAQPTPTRPVSSPQLFRSYTRQQLAAGEVPPTEFGRLLAHSYSPNGGWYVAAIPVAFQMEGSGSGTTHFSPYAYDRHVPLGLYGAPFTPGTYRGQVEPVDIAATLASILGVSEPSASVGRVLTQALKPVGEFAYPKPPAAERSSPRRATRRGTTHQAPAGERP